MKVAYLTVGPVAENTFIVINEEDAAAARRWHVVRRRQLVHMPGIGVDLAGVECTGGIVE